MAVVLGLYELELVAVGADAHPAFREPVTAVLHVQRLRSTAEDKVAFWGKIAWAFGTVLCRGRATHVAGGQGASVGFHGLRATHTHTADAALTALMVGCHVRVDGFAGRATAQPPDGGPPAAGMLMEGGWKARRTRAGRAQEAAGVRKGLCGGCRMRFLRTMHPAGQRPAGAGSASDSDAWESADLHSSSEDESGLSSTEDAELAGPPLEPARRLEFLRTERREEGGREAEGDRAALTRSGASEQPRSPGAEEADAGVDGAKGDTGRGGGEGGSRVALERRCRQLEETLEELARSSRRGAVGDSVTGPAQSSWARRQPACGAESPAVLFLFFCASDARPCPC